MKHESQYAVNTKLLNKGECHPDVATNTVYGELLHLIRENVRKYSRYPLLNTTNAVLKTQSVIYPRVIN